MCDYYRTLGIDRDASKDEIRDAFFEAARKYHPDVNPDKEGQEKFLKIQEAYEILIDPGRRAVYDSKLVSDTSKALVTLDTIYSCSVLTRLDEPQLAYAMATLRCTANPDEFERRPANICLVMDRSTSMKGDRLEVVKRNILGLFDELSHNDVFSLITFNDRAEVVIPPTLAKNLSSTKKQVVAIAADGGTEIFQGLIRGFQTLQMSPSKSGSRYLILLTDGHTYGDESSCYTLAKQAAREGVVIQAFGIGHEWNDGFLDRLTSMSGGFAQFINTPEDLQKLIGRQLNALNSVYAQQMRFDFSNSDGVEVRTVFRLSPDSAPLGIESPITIGNMEYQKQLVILFEFLVPPIQKDIRRVDLARGKIHMKLVQGDEAVQIPCWLRREVSEHTNDEPPPEKIMRAVSRLTLYRLQEKAQTALLNKKIAEATRYLQNLATHLLAQGDRQLARSVLREADSIQEHGAFSKYGDKQLKYGTRALMLPSEILVDGD